MDGIACKLPGVISPLLNGAPGAATLPQNKPRISERVKKLQLISEGKQRPVGKELTATLFLPRLRLFSFSCPCGHLLLI